MKKLLLLLSLIFVSQSAFAYVDNQFMTTEQFMLNTGFSSEMTKAIQFNNGDVYREPYQEGKDVKSLLKRAYHYISPLNEADLSFYNHSGNYNSTSWKDL